MQFKYSSKFLFFSMLAIAWPISATNYVYNNGGVTAPLTMTGTDTYTGQAGTFAYTNIVATGTINNDTSATNLGITVNSGSAITRAPVTFNGNFAAIALSGTTSATIINNDTISATQNSNNSFEDGSALYIAGANNFTLTNNSTMSADVRTSAVGTTGAHAIRANVSPSTLSYTVNINNTGTMSATASGLLVSKASVIDMTTGRLTSGTITNSGTMTATTLAGSVDGSGCAVISVQPFNNGFTINNSGTMQLTNNASSGTSGAVILVSSRTANVTNSGIITGSAPNGATAPLALSGRIANYTQTGAGQMTGNVLITTATTFTHNSTGNITGNVTLLGNTTVNMNNTGNIVGNLDIGSVSVLNINNTGRIIGNIIGDNGSIIVGNDVPTPNFTTEGTLTDISGIQVLKGSFRLNNTLSSIYDLILDAQGSGVINIGANVNCANLNLTNNNINFTAGAISVGAMNNAAIFNASSGVNFTLSGDFVNSSNMTYAGGSTTAVTFNNSGIITTTAPTSFTFSGATFTNTGTVQLIFTDENNFTTMTANNAVIDSSTGTIQVVWGGTDGATLPAGTYTLIAGAGTANVGTFIQPTFTSAYIQSMLASVSGSNVILTVKRVSANSNTLSGTSSLGSTMAEFFNLVSASNPTSAQTQLINALQAITSPDVLNNELQELATNPSGLLQAINIVQQNELLITQRINKLNLTNYYAAGDYDPKYGVWLRPFFEGGKQNNNGNLLGYKANTTGVILGMDAEVTKRLALGLAASYAYSSVKSINYANTYTNIKTYLGDIYGTYKITPQLSFDCLVSGGQNHNNSQRVINVPPVEAVPMADYISQQYAAFMAFRKDYLCGALLVSPQINASYVYLHQTAYAETNAGTLGYSVAAANSSVFTLGTGVQIALPKRTKCYTFIPQLRALVYYDMKSAAQNVTSAFVTGGPTFLISATPGRITGEFGVGLLYNITQRLNCELNYDFYVKQRYTNNVAYLNVNYLF